MQKNSGSMVFRNRVTGGVLLLIGLYVIFESLTYDIGSIARMGPGYLPVVLGVLIIILGVLIAIDKSERTEATARIAWRPVVLILAAMLSFALLVESLGLMPATAALVLISGSADNDHTWRSLLALFVVLLAMVWFIFALALGVPFELISGVL